MIEQPNPLFDGIRELRLRWRLLIAIPVAAAVLAVLVSFLFTKEYEGVAIFSPAPDLTTSLPANLETIAAQFGISAGTEGYNVYYFAQVAQSREVLRSVVLDSINADGKRTAIMEVLDVRSDDSAERIDDAVKILTHRLKVTADDQADLVTVKTRADSPERAAKLTALILEALNAATTASIQRGGSAERRFAQAQADSARAALQQVENQLRDFYLANRNITASPSLQFEEGRLRRQLQIRQDLYLGLVSQAEAAKLREVKNTPAIAVVQTPQASARKVWPRRSVWAFTALIGAFLAMASWLYVVQPGLRRGRASA
jgi:uncharacterized protein involved in exopolysaccharide biosynthesis